MEARHGGALVPSCGGVHGRPTIENPAVESGGGPSIVVDAARCEKEASAIVEKFIAAARPK